jgi:hypothetical protein
MRDYWIAGTQYIKWNLVPISAVYVRLFTHNSHPGSNYSCER